jgi:hypothetical protein
MGGDVPSSERRIHVIGNEGKAGGDGHGIEEGTQSDGSSAAIQTEDVSVGSWETCCPVEVEREGMVVIAIPGN